MIAEVLKLCAVDREFRQNWLAGCVAVARTVSNRAHRKVEEGRANPDEDGRIRLPGKSFSRSSTASAPRPWRARLGNQRKLLAINDMPPDIHHASTCAIALDDVRSACGTRVHTLFYRSDSDIVRVVGLGPPGSDFIEIVIEEGPLRQAMFRFSRNIVFLSLIISIITATLVYLSLHYLLVRPMNRLTTNMISFREDPENAARIIAPSGRNDEIGIAERELGVMQRDLPRCCSRRAISRRSASRFRRSTTTCAICSPRRSCSPTGSRACPTRTCSALRRS
jgi:hypothetical protein